MDGWPELNDWTRGLRLHMMELILLGINELVSEPTSPMGATKLKGTPSSSTGALRRTRNFFPRAELGGDCIAR